MSRSGSAAAVTRGRCPTNVTLPEALLRDARDLGINLSQACERGLAAEVMALRRQRWLQQNRDAIDAYNEHVARHGQPLACLCTRPAVLIA